MIDSTSDSEEFSFGRVDIGSIMNSFSDNFLIFVNMRNQHGNIIWYSHLLWWVQCFALCVTFCIYLSKKDPEYCQVSFGFKTVPCKCLKSRKEGLNFFVTLEKWKTSDLLCSMTSPNYLKREEMIL